MENPNEKNKHDWGLRFGGGGRVRGGRKDGGLPDSG